MLRTLPNDTLQFLLDGTVTLLHNALPTTLNFGQAVSLDTKHILAWVKENNPKACLTGDERYDKTQQPRATRIAVWAVKNDATNTPRSPQKPT